MSEGTWWVVCLVTVGFVVLMTVGGMERVEHGRQSRVWADWVPSK